MASFLQIPARRSHLWLDDLRITKRSTSSIIVLVADKNAKPRQHAVFAVEADEGHLTLAGFLRKRVGGLSWSGARRLVERGCVEIGSTPVFEPSLRVAPGQLVQVRERQHGWSPDFPLIVYEDRHLVVVDKPAGVASVPYQRGERGTIMDAIRAAWRTRGVPLAARGLYVVHRLDKETSGLLAFARTRAAERAFQAQFRKRQVKRLYLSVAHGLVRSGIIESRLVANRGDGLRGSTRSQRQGKPAVTHVRVLERLGEASLCALRLETGRTHQIRIHLAERGHPVVGERVYIRDFVAQGGSPIDSPRLLLHAATLAFDHPIDGHRVTLESPLPSDFLESLEKLRARRR